MDNELCVCGHTFVAHTGHAAMRGTVAPLYCSQGCGCGHFRPAPPPTLTSQNGPPLLAHLEQVRQLTAIVDRAEAMNFELMTKLDAAEAENERLRAALEPFAACAETLERNHHHHDMRIGYYPDSPKVKHCLAAREALKGQTK